MLSYYCCSRDLWHLAGILGCPIAVFKGGSPGSPFSLCWGLGIGPQWFSEVYGWSSGHSLKVFYLARLCFLGPLAWESIFGHRPVLSEFIGVLGLWAWPEPNLSSMRPKENSGNSPLCHSLYPNIPSWSAFFSQTFRVILCLFYI